MSRFIALKTQLRDAALLMLTLEQMGCQVSHEPQGMRMRGAPTLVEIVARAPFGAFGFRKTAEDVYEVVADERLIADQHAFLQQLLQQYAYRKILQEAQAAGYNLVHEEVQADRTIKLVVRKW